MNYAILREEWREGEWKGTSEVTYVLDGDASRATRRRRRTGSRFDNYRNNGDHNYRNSGDRRDPNEHRNTLDPLDDLDVALHAIGDFGQWIQNADTKAGMCGAVLGLLIAGVTSDLDTVHRTLGGAGSVRYPAVTLLVMFAVSLLLAGAFLGLTQVPRVPVPPTVRRLAFPAMARGSAYCPVRDLPPASAAQLRDEAWDQAEALARIAARKFQYLRMGLVFSGLCTLAFLSWLGLSAATPS